MERLSAHEDVCSHALRICPQEGCGLHVHPINWKIHIAACPKRVAKCRYVGCNDYLRQEDFPRHNKANLENHLVLEYNARKHAERAGAAPTKVLRVPEDFRTVTKAVKATGPGDRVEVGPGIYKENLIIGNNKHFSIVGTGPPKSVVLESDGATSSATIDCNGAQTNVYLENIDIRRLEGSGDKSVPWGAVTCTEGASVQAIECKITSAVGCGVYAQKRAHVFLRGCIVYSCKKCGIIICEKAVVTIDRCQILHNRLSGVQVHASGHATIRSNKIRNNSQAGISMIRRAGDERLVTVSIEDNRLENNRIAVDKMGNFSSKDSIYLKQNIIVPVKAPAIVAKS